MIVVRAIGFLIRVVCGIALVGFGILLYLNAAHEVNSVYMIPALFFSIIGFVVLFKGDI